jgi:hypothetical protein
MQSIKLSVTVRGRLASKYSAADLRTIDAAVRKWITADAARGIRTVHVAVDDRRQMQEHGAGAATVKGTATALQVKRAVDALWSRLSPDYLVLFGAPDVVPYFVVSNPSFNVDGDDEKTTPTDNPYACSAPYARARRASYLVPDRVVGRIPDMVKDGDPAWFLAYLETATKWASRPRSDYDGAYAICCDEWKDAGRDCMEYIGEPRDRLMISPPVDDDTAAARTRLKARAHMIKCHGAGMDPMFYGQKGEDFFPEALRSETLKTRVAPACLPAAMCCFGAQVYWPDDPRASRRGQWPIASTYLRMGALGFAGSTMVAWVGPGEMMCADWIAAGYLKGVLGGASLGRAMLEAKQDFVRWVQQQGRAPDLAEEKTLVEFVLLGDPSIHPVAAAPAAVPRARGAAGPALAARPSTLALQERRQRRMVRADLAVSMRVALPMRTAVHATAARAQQLFRTVEALLGKDVAQYGLKAQETEVQKVQTRIAVGVPATRAAAGIGRVRAAIGSMRDSYEYYWTGRKEHDGLRTIRLVKVEADAAGNVLRTAVRHSA